MMTFCEMKESSADKVYAQHKGMIRSMINSIVVNNPSVVSLQDLQQAGALALIIALRSYGPALGSFESYVRQCIRNALLEQANSFSGVFTVDEKVRRQANAVVKLRTQGLSDEAIMTKLGIKTRVTFISLLGLVDSHSVSLDQVDTEAEASFEEASIFRILDEIGLLKQEVKFINLVKDNYAVDDIIREMGISRTALYGIKASIRNKILAWSQE